MIVQLLGKLSHFISRLLNAQGTMPQAEIGQTDLYTSTFTFAKGEYDDEFHQLDQAIAELAKAIPGYMGEEAWENPASGLISTVYYWRSLEALRQLIEHPKHIAAKQKQAKWINGYHIVIGRVIRSYGDGRIPHPLSSELRVAGEAAGATGNPHT